MSVFSHFEKTTDILVLKQQHTTTRKIDNQVLVDEDMKKKWGEAKDGKETTATLIAVNEMVLHHFNQATNCAARDLVQLVDQYANLSFAGSCSARVRSAVRFLEDCIAKEKRKIGQDELQKVKGSLDHMMRKLEVLKKVEETREECRDRE